MGNDGMNILIGIATIVLAFGASVIGARLNRKSQKEANELTSENVKITAQNSESTRLNAFIDQVQEELKNAKEDRKAAEAARDKATAERERSDHSLATVRAQLRELEAYTRRTFRSYTAYIHILQGQITGLGAVPEPWPPNLLHAADDPIFTDTERGK